MTNPWRDIRVPADLAPEVRNVIERVVDCGAREREDRLTRETSLEKTMRQLAEKIDLQGKSISGLSASVERLAHDIETDEAQNLIRQASIDKRFREGTERMDEIQDTLNTILKMVYEMRTAMLGNPELGIDGLIKKVERLEEARKKTDSFMKEHTDDAKAVGTFMERLVKFWPLIAAIGVGVAAWLGKTP